MNAKVKGAVLLARRFFVIEEHGQEAWERVIASLPEEDRQLLTGIVLTTAWHDFAINERLDAAIAEQVGGGDPAIFEAIGARSAVANLQGPHKGFLIVGDPQRFLKMTDLIYDFYYDTGHREYEPTGPDSGVITTWEAEIFSESDCLTVIGWYKEALRMCGARDVRIEHDKCRARGDDRCRYALSWKR